MMACTNSGILFAVFEQETTLQHFSKVYLNGSRLDLTVYNASLFVNQNVKVLIFPKMFSHMCQTLTYRLKLLFSKSKTLPLVVS